MRARFSASNGRRNLLSCLSYTEPRLATWFADVGLVAGVVAVRAAVRDLLDAQDDLLAAQNALISALVSYRTAEWDIQRDMGRLEVTVEGLWREYSPERTP